MEKDKKYFWFYICKINAGDKWLFSNSNLVILVTVCCYMYTEVINIHILSKSISAFVFILFSITIILNIQEKANISKVQEDFMRGEFKMLRDILDELYFLGINKNSMQKLEDFVQENGKEMYYKLPHIINVFIDKLINIYSGKKTRKYTKFYLYKSIKYWCYMSNGEKMKPNKSGVYQRFAIHKINDEDENKGV